MKLEKGKWVYTPPPFSEIVSIKLEKEGYFTMLVAVSPGVMGDMQERKGKDDPLGEPHYYAVVGETIMFEPTPDADYEVRVLYAPPWQEA